MSGVIAVMTLLGIVGGVAALVEHRKTDRALAARHDVFSSAARRALEPLAGAHVEDVRTRRDRYIEVTFPSSRHRSTLRARTDLSGALLVTFTTPLRDTLPPLFRLRKTNSTELVNIGQGTNVRASDFLPESRMELSYDGQLVTARLTDLMSALTPALLAGLRAESSAHRARIESLDLTTAALELEATYPRSETERLAALARRLVKWSAHARVEHDSPGTFWNTLYFGTPPGSAARLGAITSIMRHAPDSSQALGLHAHVLESEDIETLRVLYACSPHPFYSKMRPRRLYDFLGHQLSSGEFTIDAIPESARALLDERALGVEALPGELRMNILGRLGDRSGHAMANHARTLYAALSERDRGEVFARANTPRLAHAASALIHAALDHEPIHIAADPRLADGFTRAVTRALADETLAWDEDLESLLARLTLGHEQAASRAADLLIARGGERALRALATLNPSDPRSGPHTDRALRALGARFGSPHLTGAVSLAHDVPEALRGALTDQGEAGALSIPEPEDPS